MKCPKCGFVSFPGLAECKKCKYQFPAPPGVSDRASEVLPSQNYSTTLFASSPSPLNEEPPHSLPLDTPESLADADPPEPPSFPRKRESLDEPRTPAAKPPQLSWQDELAERVARFRHRRARLRQAFDPRSSLKFDFNGDADAECDERGTPRESERPPGSLDLVLDEGLEFRAPAPALDSMPIERRSDAAALNPDAGQWAFEPHDLGPSASGPVEIMLEASSPEEEPELVGAIRPRLAAPLGRRFAAGILDLAVLLIASSLFAGVFLACGGRLNGGPLDLGVIAFTAAFFLVFYFGLFTGLAFATPGQSALGLQVRTLDHEAPSPQAAMWRAIGYLFSAAALMLGFVWSLFDSEGLTWHDRMSATCLTELPRPAGRGGPEGKSSGPTRAEAHRDG